MLRRLESFDGTETCQAECLRPDRYRRLFSALRDGGPAIARGAGLSYCAASAGKGVRSVLSGCFNRVLGFDAASGLVTAEAGMTLGDLFRFTVPRGWILPVMPGHPSITLGGCVGFNVHGKNQYREGNFVGALESLSLFHPDHGELQCSAQRESELFGLTVGGFGLTGFVTAVSLRLQRIESGAFRQRRIPVANLREAVLVMQEQAQEAQGLHSWHDLNGGRPGCGYVYAVALAEGPQEAALGWRALTPEERGRGFPAGFNRLTARCGAAVYAWLEGLGPEERRVGLAEGVFPVLGKEHYFHLFGGRGFREYQVLFPRGAWEEAQRGILSLIKRHRAPVTLASLKLFRGRQSLLNFAGEGVCLALDVPEGESARRLFADLDALTLAHRGIVNLSKDSRLTAEFARRAFPEYERFRSVLVAFDPKRRFDSALRRRLGV